LVERLHLDRTLSHTPLFQAMFVVQNAPKTRLALPALDLSSLELDTVAAKFDVALSLEEEADGRLTGWMEYNTDLFETATIRRFLSHYQTLLQQSVAHPETRLSALSVLGESEQHQLLVTWNDTRRAYPEAQWIHQVVEAQ